MRKMLKKVLVCALAAAMVIQSVQLPIGGGQTTVKAAAIAIPGNGSEIYSTLPLSGGNVNKVMVENEVESDQGGIIFRASDSPLEPTITLQPLASGTEPVARENEQTGRVVGYFPSHRGDIVDKIDYSALTHLNLSFMRYTNGQLKSDFSDSLMRQVLAHCKENGVKVLIAIGGGGGFDAESKPFNTKESRAEFIRTVTDYVNQYGLDGVDVDIENGDSDIIANYEYFVRELREALSEDKLLTMAVAPWFTQNLNAGIYDSIDFLNLMTYDDMAGNGPLAPMSQIERYKEHYTSKGVSMDRMNIGVPFYGYGPGGYDEGYTYSQIVDADANNRYSDECVIDGRRIYYNGETTIREKAQLSKQYGGIMIWELGQDCFDENSLLQAIKEELQPTEPGTEEPEKPNTEEGTEEPEEPNTEERTEEPEEPSTEERTEEPEEPSTEEKTDPPVEPSVEEIVFHTPIIDVISRGSTCRSVSFSWTAAANAVKYTTFVGSEEDGIVAKAYHNNYAFEKAGQASVDHLEVAAGETAIYTVVGYDNDDRIVARGITSVDVPDLTEEEKTDAELIVKIGSDENLAKAGNPFVSSKTGENIVDGNLGSTWQADPGENPDDEPSVEYFGVDLGREKNIETIIIAWGNSYATAYDIYVAGEDGVYGTTPLTSDTASGNNPIVITKIPAAKARYVKIVPIALNNNAKLYGTCVFELAVLAAEGDIDPDTPVETPAEKPGIPPTPVGVTVSGTVISWEPAEDAEYNIYVNERKVVAVSTGSVDIAEYMIEPGSYTVEIRAVNTDGVESESAAVNIEKEPSDNPGSDTGDDSKDTLGGNTGNTPGGNTDDKPGDIAPVKVSGIKISGISKKIAVKKIQLTAEIEPTNATNQEIIWTTSNVEYATVNADGVVTMKKAGKNKKVTITATAADGSGVKTTYTIKIMPKPVRKITLKFSAGTVTAGKTVKIKAIVTPSKKKLTNTELIWTSSNTEYATVNKKGIVKTKRAGKGKKVKITARATDGSNKKKTITIKIK